VHYQVPAQHTWKGIFDLLTDPTDATARELRRRYVFKMIPMLNPDGQRSARDDDDDDVCACVCCW
jgi:Zinc carboxypeptidase